MRYLAPLLAIAAIVSAARVAPAQNDAKPAGSAAPTSTSGTGGDQAAPASDAQKEPAAPKNVTGYGYGGDANSSAPSSSSAHPRAKKAASKPRPAPTGPIATLPGFEMQADGSSRCFVQLTAAVPIEEKKAAGSVTYVLKGAHVNVRNNENALVTVHFNTPVTRARLVPSAQGLSFIIELRAPVAATYKVVAGKDGTSILEVDFPKGSYVTAAAADARQAP
jgi:hypothetical protein